MACNVARKIRAYTDSSLLQTFGDKANLQVDSLQDNDPIVLLAPQHLGSLLIMGNVTSPGFLARSKPV